MSASTGKILDLRPVFGITVTIVTPAEETGGSWVEMEVVAHPGCRTALHCHPEQTETYEVIEGTLEVYQHGTWHQVSAGETVLVPHGDTHAFRNSDNRPVRFTNVHRPALETQAHLEMLDELIRAGKIRSANDPASVLHLYALATTYHPSRSVKPPQPLVSALGWMGRRTGFRPPDVARRNA